MKKLLKNSIIIAIILILAAYSNISMAVKKSDITDLQNSKKEIKDEITATEQKIEAINEEKTETMQQVEKLITQISGYEDEIDELNDKIEKLKGKIETAEKQIKEDEADYEKQKKALEARLVAMYEAGETSYLDFLLSSSNLVDFISSYYLISEIAEYDNQMLDQIEAHKNKIEKEKEQLETDKKDLDSSKVTLVSKKQGLEVVKRTKQQYVSKLTGDEKKLESLLSELTEHEQSINTRIRSLQAQYDRELAARRASNSGSSSGGSTFSGGGTSSYGFGLPINSYVTTGYGVSGRYWSSGHHTGVDFRAASGTPVYSIGDGQVVDTGDNRAYGNFVEIYHGNNIYSFYAHASSVIVSTGQYVTKGQQIMYSGATGNVTGPHLHFEIRTPGPRYANCVNPGNYIPI